jgi:hypothetical protein
MPAPVKARLVLPVAAALAALAVAGCGDSSSADAGANAATLAPASAPVYIEATIQPQGDLKANVEALAENLGGVDDLGDLIISKAEEAANESGEPLDYGTEVEPWLGDVAGLYLERYDGDEFEGYGVAVSVTDTDAAQAFVDDHAETDDGEPYESGAYQGTEYDVDPEDETTVGIVDDFLVIAEDLRSFKAMVDASEGESLAESESYGDATSGIPSGSIATVFVDIGGLIDQSGDAIDPDAKTFLDTAGIEPEEATALASVVPGSNQVEIEISSDLSGDNPPTGDASKLLGQLPAGSAAAIASADFGKRFGEAIDEIDAEGIPDEIPPNELKKTMKAAGIDLEKISSSVGNLAVFAEGNSESDLAGAAVLETKDASEAKNTVANVGLFLRAADTSGITAIGGKFSGFSVRSDDLGSKPLVVAAAGARIAVAYGLPAATKALAEGGATLSGTDAYKDAVSALGDTPISGFVDGPGALRLATALIPADDKEDFDEAKPYLGKIDYVAIGGGASGDRSTVKLIAGVGK